MTDWHQDVRELIAARRASEAFAVLEQAAEEYPDAAREFGHMLLQVAWFDADEAEPQAEKWLRRVVSARPEDVQATILLATLLAVQHKQLLDRPWHPALEHGQAAAEQRVAEACRLYSTAQRLAPRSGAAASGLALLLNDAPVTGEDVPSAATIAEWALEINPDEPVAMLVLAELTGDDRLRERAEALSPEIPSARWRTAREGGPVSPFGHGVPSRFDYFVIEVAVEVTNQGDTAPGYAVLRDIEQVKRFDVCTWNVAGATAYQYERGILIAKHTAARLSGKTLSHVAVEWQVKRDPSVAGEPLPIGHPVRHDGETLRYGANGVQWADADI